MMQPSSQLSTVRPQSPFILGNEAQRVNRELYKRNAELASRNKTLALLRKLGEMSLSAEEMEKMSEQMTKAIAADLGYEIVSLAIVVEKKNILQWLAISSVVPWIAKALLRLRIKEISEPLDDGLISIEAIRREKEIVAEGLEQVFPSPAIEAITNTVESKVRDPVIKTALYPLKFGGKTVGLLTLSTARSWESVSEYEKESITSIVGLVALALYKAKIARDLRVTSRELAEANQQLKNLDKAKSEFLNIASHQLYTPLTALRGYLSMLGDGDYGEVPATQKPIMDILTKSTTRLIELIKGLLDISRIESGRLELKLESLDLEEMSHTLVQDLMPNARNKKLQLVFHKPPQSLPHVVGDRERLRQVMLNFIDNAIKYTPQGSVDVSLTQIGGEIMFSVKDTGRGLEPDEIARLFNKFTRVGGAARYHTEGSGLGLYVAKQITHEHRGDVTVESAGPGSGSTFSLRLPIEGSAKSLKVGEKASVVIKAAEAQGSHEAAK